MQSTQETWQTLDKKACIFRTTYDIGAGDVTTVAVALSEGKFLVLSPGKGIAETASEALREHGEVVALLAPNAFHQMGMSEWAAQWPQARCFAPELACERIQKKHRDLHIEPLATLQTILPPHIQTFVPPHLKSGESITRVQGTDGWIWIVTDLLTNLSALPSNFLLRWMFKMVGSRPGLGVNGFFRLMFIRDRAKLKQWFEEELQRYPPSMLIVGHGDVVTGEALGAKIQEAVHKGLP